MNRTNEDGASLLGLIVAVVLILIVGGGAFYGYTNIDKNGKSQPIVDDAKNSIDTSVVSSAFRMDVAGANAVQLGDGGQSLDIAKGDGTCIHWEISSGASKARELQRSTAFGMNAKSSTLGSVSTGIESGSFGATSDSATLDLSYSGGQSFNQQMKFSGNGQGGDCW